MGTLVEPNSRFYRARRLQLHYVDWGNEGAPALVLVHGGLDHCRSWDWVAAALRADFHVVAVDLAGHGDSDHAIGGCYALTDFVFDLAELFRACNFERASLVGHSMGGGVSSIFAGAFPDLLDRLILVEGLRPAMLAPEPAHERIRLWVEQTRDLSRRIPRAYETIEQAVARMRAANPVLSSEQARHLTRHGLKRGDDGLWRWKYDNFIRSRSPASLPRDEVQALWRRVHCPTLLIGGDASGRPDPSQNGWLDQFQDAKSVLVPGAGHWVHHDRLDAFLALARPFLASPAS
jgi:pimeloyl-ACP methyl ester carboxylesterase